MDIADPKLSGDDRGAARYLLDNYSWIEGEPKNPDCSKPLDSVNNWDNQNGISQSTLHDMELIANHKTSELWTDNLGSLIGSAGLVVSATVAAGRLFGPTGALVTGAILGTLCVLGEGYHLYHQSTLNQHLPTK